MLLDCRDHAVPVCEIKQATDVYTLANTYDMTLKKIWLCSKKKSVQGIGFSDNDHYFRDGRQYPFHMTAAKPNQPGGLIGQIELRPGTLLQDVSIQRFSKTI
jgi:hypothetical protein